MRIKDFFIKKKATDPIEEMASILDVDLPTIYPMAAIFYSRFLNGKLGSLPMLQAMKEFRPAEIPADAIFLGGFYDDRTNTIFISSTYPKPNRVKGGLDFIKVSPSDQLFTVAHELRHQWQKKFHQERFYKKNAVGMEIINDPAEIDADAFAIAYIFSGKTSLTAADLPIFVSEMRSQGALDGGKRWERAMRLSEKYGFGSPEKITAAKG